MKIGGPLTNPLRGIACLGDSQTVGTAVPYADRWATLIESLGLPIRNWGKGSAKTGWALGRDHDQIPPSTFAPVSAWSTAKSRVYICMFGLNDVAVSYHPELTPAERLELFNTQTTELVDLVESVGGIPVLMTNSEYPSTYTNYIQRNIDTSTYDQIKRTLAATRSSVYLIDLWQRFADEIAGGNIDWFVGPANLHWNVEGHSIVTNQVETDLVAYGLV